jgi:pyruvate dehydrogenase (quinone)/pyruvate oxidase
VTQTAADALIERLIEWNVKVVYGIPGDGINGLMEALRKRRDRIRFLQTRHEESAAFMACAHAKFTGELGVCLATSGPGGIHLLNGLYDAKLDGQPVLAITGLQFHDLIGTHTQQDVELDKTFLDVAAYNARVMGPAHVINVLDLACQTALARRGVAHLAFPVDLQTAPCDDAERSRRNRPRHTAGRLAEHLPTPAEADVRAAAAILNDGDRVAILAGQGALAATDELLAVAERLGAPIVKALLGKAVVPDDHPLTTGGIGLLGTRPSQEALEACDTLLMVGTSFPYIEFLPKPGQARAVQIDVDAARIGLRAPVEVGLVGDSAVTLKALLPHLVQKADRSFLVKAQAAMRDWWGLMEARGSRRDHPMKPQVLAWELGKLLSDDAIVTSDSGTITTWWARQIKARRGQMYSCSGNLATMACGLPYAIAAQVAYPQRLCVAFVGDGGFSMLMAELATCVKYDLPVKIVVVKNNALGQIKWEQMVFLGNPEYGVDLQPVDFAKVATAFGVAGYRITEAATCAEILELALRAPGPALIEAEVDALEPPLPARVELEQAWHFAEALARGQPYRGQIALTALADKVRELV